MLREANNTDLKQMMAWRNQPEVYQGFYQQKEPLTRGEHLAWWKSRNQDWRTFIINYKGQDVGVITIGQLDHWSPEIGYYIGEVSLWGKGIGKKAVQKVLEILKTYGKQYTHTTVLENNERSLRLLKSLGFEILGKAREGEVWLTLKIK